MSIELAAVLYNNIGRIKHLRTYEFLKAICENQGADQWSRITYAQWRDKYGIHAFILNECTRECQELGLIEVGRENKSGLSIDGGKGTKRIYKLTVDNKSSKVIPNIESPKENTPIESEPEATLPKTVEPKKIKMLETKFEKGRLVSINKKLKKFRSIKKAI